MDTPDKYIKFIDPNDEKKYYIYEYVMGHGENGNLIPKGKSRRKENCL